MAARRWCLASALFCWSSAGLCIACGACAFGFHRVVAVLKDGCGCRYDLCLNDRQKGKGGFSPEDVRDNWAKICDFSSATHPGKPVYCFRGGSRVMQRRGVSPRHRRVLDGVPMTVADGVVLCDSIARASCVRWMSHIASVVC